MKFSNFKHKAIILTAGVATLFATSCKDFLEMDVYDQYSTEGIKTYQQFQTLSGALYGGYPWASYEGKFSWCVNEGIPGVLYNVYDKEGALFKLSIGDDNTILKEGYTSLYAGVIGTANQVIHKTQDLINSGDYPSGMSENEARIINAEGRLFRAYAHFLATEYFGEVPLVWNTSKDIAESVTLPLATRATLYKAIEVDLLEAEKYLPNEDPTSTVRATKWAAKALLAKLYLTMASCQSDIVMGNQYPYKEQDVQGKYNEVVRLCTEILNVYGNNLDKHANIFSASSRQSPSKETLFALYFRGGEYGEGSAYQSQMGTGAIWSPGSGWGSGKGLTYTLYKSFDDTDERKKELCLFVGTSGEGNIYYTVDGTPVKYGVPGFDVKNDKGSKGKDFLSSGAGVLNNIKKYVWGLNGTGFHDVGMSIDRRVDVVRVSDVYFMRAEAKMALENRGVGIATSAGLEDINKVLEAHGAPKLTEAIPFCENIQAKRKTVETFTITVDGQTNTYDITLGDSMYHSTTRLDLMQELRKEFAMEGHAWLDLKRLYYRDPVIAANFMIQMDRACQMAQSPAVSEEGWENESGYARKAVVNALNAKLAVDFPNAGYKVGNSEEIINYGEFFGRNQWFLPIPASAKTTLNSKVQDFVEQVEREQYPY